MLGPTIRLGQPDVPRDEEWLLIEWPKGEAEPTKYFLSTLPADISRRNLPYPNVRH